jgi:membrane-associated protease RseP (regulator of RpoE activity)
VIGLQSYAGGWCASTARASRSSGRAPPIHLRWQLCPQPPRRRSLSVHNPATERFAATATVIELAISLSISLTVLNMLPIPALDGGQILMSCLEAAFPSLIRLRAVSSALGMLLLAGLMIYVNLHDVIRYWVSS